MASSGYELLAEAYILVTRAMDYDPSSVDDLRKLCTWETCPVEFGFWGYRPSLIANVAFLFLFAVSTLLYIGEGFWNKAWPGFTIAMICGCLLEVIGYIGRVMAWSDGFTEVNRWCFSARNHS